MKRLNGSEKYYAWGSTTLIPHLAGHDPTSKPLAELWFGAHPSGPSTTDSGETLLELISQSPSEELGSETLKRFDGQLPFMVKLLAAAQPLSIQTHPNARDAAAGFAQEEAAGLAISDPQRSFRDPNAKPELIVALEPFEALVGFRPIPDTIALLATIGLAESPLATTFAERGPTAAITQLLAPQSNEERTAFDDAMLSLLEFVEADQDNNCSSSDLVRRLHNTHPEDPGILVALLLNHVVLQPGEALFLNAGTLHGYVDGLALEVMGNSDNVLRGGLTPKTINIPGLLHVLSEVADEPMVLTADNTGEIPCDADPFRVWQVITGLEQPVSGPAIVVCVDGAVQLTTAHQTMDLSPTYAAWVSGNEKAAIQCEGSAFVVRPRTS